ncbi:MAG TPA: DUF2029 domain-containing protein [Clostridiales bacterium]|nr:DUF2029 domain-containing protein [Clostridiales bacterium]
MIKRNKPVLNAQQYNDLLIKFFIVFFVINMAVCLIFGFISNGDAISIMLNGHGKPPSPFRDFYESIYDGSKNYSYTQSGNIYPPVALLFFRFMSKIITPDLLSLWYRYIGRMLCDQRTMIVFLIFCIICLLWMYNMLNKKFVSESNRKLAPILCFCCIFSYPVVYCIERGNVVILSMLLTMFFVFARNDESKYVRELSYISLAFAAGTKLYPAIFGLLLLKDKNFKGAIRTIIYGFIVIAVPFMYFYILDPTTNIELPAIFTASASSADIQTNVAAAEETKGVLKSYIDSIGRLFNRKSGWVYFGSVSIENLAFMTMNTKTKDNQELRGEIGKILFWASEIIALSLFFFAKKEWQKVSLLTYLMLNIPAASSAYAMTFIIIPFACFVCEKEKSKIDWFYMACFAILLSPLPTLWYFNHALFKALYKSYLGIAYIPSLNKLTSYVIYQLMHLVMLIQIITITFSKDTEKKDEMKNKPIECQEFTELEEAVI